MAGLRLLAEFINGYLKLKTTESQKIIGSTGDIQDSFGCCCSPDCCCCEPKRVAEYTLASNRGVGDALPSEIFVTSSFTKDCALSEQNGTDSTICCCNKWEVWAVATNPPYRPNSIYPALIGSGNVSKTNDQCYIKREDLPGFHLGLKNYIATYEIWAMCDGLTACCDVTYNARTANKSSNAIFSKCCRNDRCCSRCSKKWREEKCPDECERYEDEKQRGRCFSYRCNGRGLKKPKNC